MLFHNPDLGILKGNDGWEILGTVASNTFQLTRKVLRGGGQRASGHKVQKMVNWGNWSTFLQLVSNTS